MPTCTNSSQQMTFVFRQNLTGGPSNLLVQALHLLQGPLLTSAAVIRLQSCITLLINNNIHYTASALVIAHSCSSPVRLCSPPQCLHPSASHSLPSASATLHGAVRCCAGEFSTFYFGQNHPMKPHRLTMTHQLVLGYDLHEHMDVFVSELCPAVSSIVRTLSSWSAA